MASIVSCEPRRVVGGVDTHKHLHVAAVIDAVGRSLASQSFSATRGTAAHDKRRVADGLSPLGAISPSRVGSRPAAEVPRCDWMRPRPPYEVSGAVDWRRDWRAGAVSGSCGHESADDVGGVAGRRRERTRRIR
jgi:hypothetical protein